MVNVQIQYRQPKYFLMERIIKPRDEAFYASALYTYREFDDDEIDANKGFNSKEEATIWLHTHGYWNRSRR